MVKLLMIADDFTGALDSGVQLAVKGAKTRVILDKTVDFKEIKEDIDVLVVDAETRHMKPEAAYKIVYKLTKDAEGAEIPYILKKTDSALRGNVGAELAAVSDASAQEILPFLPAFPRMNRITREGKHYVDGVPVNESVFGKDPFEPVKHAYIPKIICEQKGIDVQCVTAENDIASIKGKGIAVFDSESDAQMVEVGKALHRQGLLRRMAGCAGLAEKIPEILGWNGTSPQMPRVNADLLVVCGSINPITQKQLAYAERAGFFRERLSVDQKLKKDYFLTEQGKKQLDRIYARCKKNSRMIIDTSEQPGRNAMPDDTKEHGISLETCRVRISEALGQLVQGLIERGLDSTILMTGGDTLLGFMKQTQNQGITPICEVATGTVLFQFQVNGKHIYGFSKSGGFGEEDLLAELAVRISEE